jgi:bis(5'-adenosyl)-triphosphatase
MICPFCENLNIKDREVIRNEYAWAFPTNIPIVPGHLLICPIRCVETIDELFEQELMAIFDLIQKLKPVLKKSFNATGFNYSWNEGRVAGQSVPHVHIHILPRKERDMGITEYEPRKFLYRPGSREVSPEDELKAVAMLLREQL